MRALSRRLLALSALALGCSAPSDPDAAMPDAASVDGATSDDAGLDAPLADVPSPSACELPVAFDVGIAPSRTLFVAVGGSGDGSAGAPLGDIEAAIRAATPGTLVSIAPGTYDGGLYLENVHGTAEAPIWLRGEAGAIIDAGGTGEVLHVSEASYFVIEGLEMRNGAANGLNIDDGGSSDTPAHHVVLRDLYVHDIGTGGNNDCIKLSGLDDFFVLDSRIEACDAGDGVDQVGCHRGFLHGNHFSDLRGGGIQMKGGSSDSWVHGNTFDTVAGRAINAGGSTGLEFFRPIDAPFEAARLTIEANLFIRGGSDSGAAVAFVGCDGCRFFHNTIIEPQTWVVRILQESTDPRFVPSRDGLFVNNIVVFNQADLRTFVNVGGGTAPETFTFGSNLWFALDDPAFSGPALPSEIPAETGSIIQRDPMLGGGWNPCASLPGRAVPDATADFTGTCWDSPPTMGAGVYVSCTL